MKRKKILSIGLLLTVLLGMASCAVSQEVCPAYKKSYKKERLPY